MTDAAQAKRTAPPTVRKPERAAGQAILREIDASLARIDAGIAVQQKKMDELLAKLARTAA